MKSLKQISPSPILEAITEVRFNGNLPGEAIFGKLYAALSEDFNTTEQLPILEVPTELRDRPQFQYAPHYRLKSDKFLINIGPRIISINQLCNDTEYSSWNDYSQKVKQVLEEVKNNHLIDETSRVAVRYINFFDKPIPEVLNLKISLFKREDIDYNDISLSFTRKLGDNKDIKVEIKTGANVNSSTRFQKEGLIVAFEAYKNQAVQIDSVYALVDDLHKDVKDAFTTALNDKFLESLKPQYE